MIIFNLGIEYYYTNSIPKRGNEVTYIISAG
jgi:hypothetical protein